MRIVFMGTPAFALPVLFELCESYDVCAVYTRPDKPSGRGMKMQGTPVREYAESRGVVVHTPRTLRSSEEVAKLSEINPDVVVVVAYGLILPKEILSIPRFGCLNIHPSLLPRWRGASPVQSAIMAGDTETGVAIMLMDEGLDTGDVVVQEVVAIDVNDNLVSLHDKLAKCGARLMINVLSTLRIGQSLSVSPQSKIGVTYCGKVVDYCIDWRWDAVRVVNFIRAVYPKAFCVINGKRFKIIEADVCSKNVRGEVGDLCGDGRFIKCIDGTCIELKVVQLEGRKPCKIDDFLRGWHI